MQFTTSNGLVALPGRVVYRAADYAFDFEIQSHKDLSDRVGQHGTTSLLIGTLQIEVSIETGLLLYVWGYCPSTQWSRATVIPAFRKSGCVKLISSNRLEVGISEKYVKIMQWPIVYDDESGWICVGKADQPMGANWIEFATDTIAVVQGTVLYALLLRPDFE